MGGAAVSKIHPSVLIKALAEAWGRGGPETTDPETLLEEAHERGRRAHLDMERFELHGGSTQGLLDIRRDAADAALHALCAVMAIDEELEGE
jgi:hypothetical protein